MNGQRRLNDSQQAIFYALLAALLFGLNAPLAKLLLLDISPIYMAAFLYLGAALGMSLLGLILRHQTHKVHQEASLAQNDRTWIILMILLDILAPFLLMWGLTLTSAATASLLNNFEMVATALIAFVFFKEAMGRRVWLAILIIAVASMILSIDIPSLAEIRFSKGSLLILAACVCWGMENNCTRNLSAKDPLQIVMLKGFGSGLGALLIALISGSPFPIHSVEIVLTLCLGFVSYGLSIFFYIKAQRWIGAARTGMYYAAAPFMGVLISFLVFHEKPGLTFVIGLILMLCGSFLAMNEKHLHRHRHLRQIHEHPHNHLDGHHTHGHDFSWDPGLVHTHVHEHQPVEHEHEHQPDIHHRHSHHG